MSEKCNWKVGRLSYLTEERFEFRSKREQEKKVGETGEQKSIAVQSESVGDAEFSLNFRLHSDNMRMSVHVIVYCYG